MPSLNELQEVFRRMMAGGDDSGPMPHFTLPLRGSLLQRIRMNLAPGTDQPISTNGRVVGQLIVSVSTGILDLYFGNMSGTDMGFGDLRYTPAPGYPIITPMPEGMGVSEFTLHNKHTTETLTGMIIFTD